jgi:anti-sigma factor (TIGR02949 family)
MNPADTSLSCQEMVDRLEDYVDRHLEPDELRRVEAHLAHCLACASEYRFEAGILNGIRERLGRISLPADLMTAIRARMDKQGD